MVVADYCTITKIGKRRLFARADLITLYRIVRRCTSLKRITVWFKFLKSVGKGLAVLEVVSWIFPGYW
jgi:hypothetical protein